jgi:hypothetical protein
LLDGVCEAVVHLNANLYVTQPSERLATMLLRSGDKRGFLKKVYFPSLVAHAETERVKSHIESTSTGTGTSLDDKPAYPLHTTLLDAVGTKVSVQLQVVCIRGRCGYKHYVVGVSTSEINEGDAVADLDHSAKASHQADWEASSGSEHSSTYHVDEPPSITFTITVQMGKVISSNPSFYSFFGEQPRNIVKIFGDPDSFMKFCIEQVDGKYGPAAVYARRGTRKKPYSVEIDLAFGIYDGVAHAQFVSIKRMSKRGTPATSTKQSMSETSSSDPDSPQPRGSFNPSPKSPLEGHIIAKDLTLSGKLRL